MAPRRTDQKERIRREAALLFARNGYGGTGIEELSRAVGLGRGALYHHIGSKERLLFEIVTVHVLDVVALAEEIAARPLAPEEKLRELSRLIMRTVVEHLPEWTVFHRDMGALSGDLRRDAFAARDAFEAVWAGAIREGIEQGVFRELDPAVVKGMLGMHNYAHVWIREHGRLSPDELADAFCDILLGGISRNGRAAPRAPA